MRRLCVAAVIVLMGLGLACSKSSEDKNSPLYKAVLDTAPKGFVLQEGPASGPMDIDTAAKSTAADALKKKSALRRAGFQFGYSRLWINKENKDDYVYVLGHEFAAASGAQDMLNFEIEQLQTKRGYQPFGVSEIEGAKGYLLSGTKGNSSSAVFCQGVVFTKTIRLFHVFTCSAQPNSGETVKDLAKDQEAKAAANASL